ncbi:MAG: type II secretion system protein [Rhodocyclaceae bacterium]|nr:type II secretion system protein [Rhodocyclaceae bacterium]
MKQKGFTLIELIVVIIVLSVLAAVALPRFVDIKSDAVQAAVDATAGAVASASVLNYSRYQQSTGAATALDATGACTTLITSTLTGLVGASLPSGITVTGDSDCTAPASGATATCTLSHSGVSPAKTASAPVICTG